MVIYGKESRGEKKGKLILVDIICLSLAGF